MSADNKRSVLNFVAVQTEQADKAVEGQSLDKLFDIRIQGK